MKQLEINFINQLCSDLEKLNGTDFEYFCNVIFELILSESAQHKGHNLYAKPVKSTADFNSDNYKSVGQCGTDQNYFDNLNKPIRDIEGAINNHPQCHDVYLFANQRAAGGKLSDLNNIIVAKEFKRSVYTYDSEKITKEVVLENILDRRIELLLNKYAPSAYQMYLLLPKTNTLPKHTSKHYYERQDESSIISILEDKKLVQIYGSSGIGKSETSKSIAKKIKDNYETVIWVNGDDTNNINFDFMSVHISRFNSKINLGSLLENHKIVLILDNFNVNISYIEREFKNFNIHNSVCLITSLQKNIPDEKVFHLEYLDHETAKNILLDTGNIPPDDIADGIIDYVDGYPLVLSIIRDSVDNNDYTWADILNEIKNVVSLEDQNTNVKIATRILERSLSQIKEELYWIYLLKSRCLSLEFFKFSVKSNGIKALLKRSIISHNEISSYSVHQIIFDSIIAVFENFSEGIDFYHEKILSYLKIEVEIKSVGYFNFLSIHRDFIVRLYDSRPHGDELKRHLMYSMAQGRDENGDEWIINELNKFNLDDESKISRLLLIEKIEIELYSLKKAYGAKDNRYYLPYCMEKISELESMIENCKDLSLDKYLRHHLGKIYSRIGEYRKAKDLFMDVIEKDSNADYARLQIARIGVWHDKNVVSPEELSEHIDQILSRSDNWNNQSLSVLLATYELISENKMESYRSQYIDSCIHQFANNLLYSLSFGFEQPFELLAKLSYHLSYNKKEIYEYFCDSLPLPSTIEKNDKVKYAFATIQVAYYRQLKYSNDSNRVLKMGKAFSLAETYYKSINLNDFQRGKFVDLYIESGCYAKALCELNKYINQVEDPFFFQKKCKIYRCLGGNDNLEISINSIDNAILLLDSNSKYVNYKSAFLNDKAETLNYILPDRAVTTLEEAIALEKNYKTLLSWKEKLQRWKNHLQTH